MIRWWSVVVIPVYSDVLIVECYLLSVDRVSESHSAASILKTNSPPRHQHSPSPHRQTITGSHTVGRVLLCLLHQGETTFFSTAVTGRDFNPKVWKYSQHFPDVAENVPWMCKCGWNVTVCNQPIFDLINRGQVLAMSVQRKRGSFLSGCNL